MKSFGEIIKQARKEQCLVLKKVAVALNIDQAIISKLERGERKPSKEQVLKFSEFYKLNQQELIIAWLSDKVVYNLENETLAEEALKVAERKIQYLKSNKYE